MFYLEKRSCQLFYCSHGKKNHTAILRKVLGISLRVRLVGTI